MAKRVFLTVHDRGNLTLPADLRRQYHLDDPGSQVELVARPDGVIELRPHVPIPADQAWFWTAAWQKGERAVDEHVAAGRLTVDENIDAFIGSLDKARRKRRGRRS